jgi:hypothetical protein
MMQMSTRGFAGGAKRPDIDPKTTDYDLVMFGGVSAGSMGKHIQENDLGKNLKIAFISEQGKFIEPTNYFPILHGHLNEQKAESYTIQAVIDKWSKLEIMNPVTNINANGNSITL